MEFYQVYLVLLVFSQSTTPFDLDRISMNVKSSLPSFDGFHSSLVVICSTLT